MALITATRLDLDRARAASQALFVVAVELDQGTLFLGDRRLALGSDSVLGAVLTLNADGNPSLDVEAQALPAEYADAWWINRQAALIECTPDMGSVYDGSIIFDGIIAAQPAERDGVLSITLAPPRDRLVTVPDYGIIDSLSWPAAAPAAVGAIKPLIFGTVEDCPLLAVQLPPATSLATEAMPGDAQLDVADASLLDSTGTVVVDGHSYAYSARAGNTLLGMTITGAHRPGTAVVQSGSTEFLAAGHAVTAIGAVKSGGNTLPAGSVNLATASVSFASPPLLLERAERFSVIAQFDQVGIGATALNAINAIRAVTGTQSQAAQGALPAGVVSSTQDAGIGFARPAGHIVKGIYTVSFSVTINAQVGWARVKIGGDVVWMMEAPASVLYHWSPATILNDSDIDFLPVVVEVEDGGSPDQVVVSVTAASRVVSIGNLDDANFATLRGPSSLLWRADQTDAMPDRGAIVSARLWVRWFANGAAALPDAAVKFAGRSLGKLQQTQLAAATLSQTVTVDVTSQGSASLPQQSISTYVSGGTASLSHASIPQAVTVTAAFSYPFVVGGLVIRRGFSRVPVLTGWDSGQGSIVCKVQVQTTGAAPDDLFKWVDFRRANGGTITQVVSAYGGWSNVASNIWEKAETIGEVPDHLYWNENNTGNGISFISVTFAYNARLTNGAVVQNNTPAGGYSNPIYAQSLGNSGISVRANNGGINFTVPAPPRVIDSFFDLSWVRSWGDLTGQAEIAYASGGPDLCLNQVALIVDYDAPIHARADVLTATVSGLSGNPADILAVLAGKSGQKLAPRPLAAFRAWCASHDYLFGRRIAEVTDVKGLIDGTGLAMQANLMLADTADGLAPIRRLDVSALTTAITDADLLAPADISWSESAENDITLKYRADASGGTDFTGALRATAANNTDCAASLAATRQTTAIQIEAGFIRSAGVATRCLADTARLVASPRRTIVLELPYRYAFLEAGSLIEYRDLLWRVTRRSRSGGWVTLTCERVPQ